MRDVRISGTLVGGQSGVALDDQLNTVRLVVYTCGPAITPTLALNTVLNPETMVGAEHIYLDKCWTLVTNGALSSGYLPAARYIDVTVPIDRVITYTSTTSSAVPIQLFFLAVSDSGTSPSPGFTTGSVVVTFEDM